MEKGDETAVHYRWNSDVEGFKMPIKVTTSKDHFEFIYPTNNWQTLKLKDLDPAYFKLDSDEFLCKEKISRYYIDPQSDITIF
jgi:hypothetical protein